MVATEIDAPYVTALRSVSPPPPTCPVLLLLFCNASRVIPGFSFHGNIPPLRSLLLFSCVCCFYLMPFFSRACTSNNCREVRLALSDDFDTPRAVRHLASLCALISPHLKELTQGDLGPVVSARNFAAETLALLGVGGSSIGVAAAGGGLGEMKGGGGERGGLVGNDGLPPAREVVDAMVEFRRMARKHVLERNLKKNPVSAKLMKR